MSKQPENINPLDPLGTWRVARDASLESWSRMMIEFINSDAYSQATGQWLDTYLTYSKPFQRAIENTMTQVLTGLNIPVRTDVTNLAERLTNIEIRLDDLDIKLDDIQRTVQALPTSKPTADTNIETHLDNLDAKLDAIQRAVKVRTNPATKRVANASAKAKEIK
jgi:polyhydroxyalkanoic acid synthase PhaR subunit